ncbi:MAG: 50S ribosomal protein L32e [Thermoplasmata archaeon]|nr:50S ribosomal protein L32e [Thermoplasmata archaeon]
MPEDKKKVEEETPKKEPAKKKEAPKKASKKEEKKYKPKAKPELTPEEKVAMDQRREKKRKTPHFRRQEWFRYKKLGDKWRKPRGIQSKARRNMHNRPKVVSTGFGGPTLAKGRHPSGFQEVMVFRPADLEGLDSKRQAIRIGHSVGYLKRIYIAIQADEMDLRILNFNRQAHDELLEEAKKRDIKLPSKGGSK